MSTLEDVLNDGLKYGYHRDSLLEYWKSRTGLPRIPGYQIPFYFLLRSLKLMSSARLHVIVATLAVAFSFFLLGGFILLLQNTEMLLQRAGGDYDFTFYLDTVPEEQLTEFLTVIRDTKGVLRAELLTSNDAILLMRTEVDGFAELFSGLNSENILPPSIDISFSAEIITKEEMRNAVRILGENVLVREVVAGKEWVSGVTGILSSLRVYGILSFFFVCLVLIMLIAGVMKLTALSVADETAVMRLLGADESTIQLPFFISGICQSCVGAVLGLLSLKIVFIFFSHEVSRSLASEGLQFDIIFLDWFLGLIVVVASLLVGGLASYLAIGNPGEQERDYLL
ncbi:MAG: FtsX-like permease family protein [bacterium]|nr:FtsX-like permease family protein [bacterium]